jgi:two-component system, chemotaxis family, protein-glutamate methylesterase/glutaminase
METKQSIEATCPECRGPLSVYRIGTLTEVRCLVGHAYSAAGLLRAHSETQEKALWAAMVGLKETRAMIDAVRDQFPESTVRRLLEQAEKKSRQATALQEILSDLEPFEV